MPDGGEAVAVVGTGGALVAGGDTVETRNAVKLRNIRPKCYVNINYLITYQ